MKLPREDQSMADINQHITDRSKRDNFIERYIEKHVHCFREEVRMAMKEAWRASRRYARSQASGETK